MTDMRATERLLEVIEEHVEAAWPDQHRDDRGYLGVLEAVRELRRRGDTLVRRDDLRLVMENTSFHSLTKEDPTWSEAITRLENAIGGKL